VRGVFTTLGTFPHPSDTGCSAPGFVTPDTITVNLTRWRTDRGLHVGDSVGRLRVLYSGAARHRNAWWLVTRRKDPLWGTYGQLTATTGAGRVLAFTLVLHAQGD